MSEAITVVTKHYPKLVRHVSTIDEHLALGRPRGIFGRRSLRVCSQGVAGGVYWHILVAVWAKMVRPRVVYFGTLENPKLIPHRPVASRLSLEPSKNALQRGF